jgi:hypothetical protein
MKFLLSGSEVFEAGRVRVRDDPQAEPLAQVGELFFERSDGSGLETGAMAPIPFDDQHTTLTSELIEKFENKFHPSVERL